MEQVGGGGVAGYNYAPEDVVAMTDFNSVTADNAGTSVPNARIVQPQLAYQQMRQGIQMFQHQTNIATMQRADGFPFGFSQSMPLQNTDLNQMIVRMQQIPGNNMNIPNMVNYNDTLAFLAGARQAAAMTSFDHFGNALPPVNSQNQFAQTCLISCDQQQSAPNPSSQVELDGSNPLNIPPVNNSCMTMAPCIYNNYLGQNSSQTLNSITQTVLTNMQSMQTLLNIPQLRPSIVQAPQQMVNPAALPQFCNAQLQHTQISVPQLALEGMPTVEEMQQDPLLLQQSSVADKNGQQMQATPSETGVMIPNNIVQNANQTFIMNPNNPIFQQQLLVIPNLSLQQGLQGGLIPHPTSSIVELDSSQNVLGQCGEPQQNFAPEYEEETDSELKQEDEDSDTVCNTEENTSVDGQSEEILDSAETENVEENYSEANYCHETESHEEDCDSGRIGSPETINENDYTIEENSKENCNLDEETDFDNIPDVESPINDNPGISQCEPDSDVSLEFEPHSVACSTPAQVAFETADPSEDVGVGLEFVKASSPKPEKLEGKQVFTQHRPVHFFFMGKLESKNTPNTRTVVPDASSEMDTVENEVIEIVPEPSTSEKIEVDNFKTEIDDNACDGHDAEHAERETEQTNSELIIKSENLDEYEEYLEVSKCKLSTHMATDPNDLQSSFKKEEKYSYKKQLQPNRRKFGVNKRKLGTRLPLRIKSTVYRQNVDKMKQKYNDDKIISEISSSVLGSNVLTDAMLQEPGYQQLKTNLNDRKTEVQSKPYAITSPSFNQSAAKAVMTTTVADNATIVTISILSKSTDNEAQTKTLNINQAAIPSVCENEPESQSSEKTNDSPQENEGENTTVGVERTSIMSRLKPSKKKKNSGDQLDRLEVNIRIEDSQLITHGEQKRWQCHMCPKSYTTKHNLVTHILDHSGIKPHLCMVCGKYFKQLSHLNTHMLTHDNIKPHVCQICGKGFTQISHLKRHQAVHLDSKPYLCDMCGRGFAYPSELRAHKEKHIPGRDKCADCGEEFSSMKLLRQHQLTHEHRDDLTCKVCEKVFRYPSQLRDHMASHGGARPFICTECGMDFMKEHHLKAHQFTHTGLKPYACEYCGRSFNQKANMMRHMLIHNAERAFECDVCGKTFTQPQTLKAHKVVHAETKPFHCKFCGKQFGRLHNLQGHMHMHNNSKPYVCFCGSSFTLKGRPYVCFCGSSFTLKF
ncbi:hypothetical protein ScPMuIL_018682 [Solemya velum]